MMFKMFAHARNTYDRQKMYGSIFMNKRRILFLLT